MQISSFEITTVDGRTYGFNMLDWNMAQTTEDVTFTNKKDTEQVAFIIKNIARIVRKGTPNDT